MKIKAILCTLTFAALSQAAITFSTGNGPANNNLDIATETGNTVSAEVGNTDIFAEFTSTATLVGNGGQAKITQSSGDITSAITFTIPGYTFDIYEFNPRFGSGTLQVSAVSALGENFLTTYALGNGNNRAYVLEASPDDSILSVTLTPIANASYEELLQPRIGGIEAVGTGSEVPEPGTYALMGSALTGLFMLRRRR